MILGLNSLAEFGGEGLREKFQSSELVVMPNNMIKIMTITGTFSREISTT